MIQKFNAFCLRLWTSQILWLLLFFLNGMLLLLWVHLSSWALSLVASASGVVCALRADELESKK